jgi:hypothetical protein
MKSLRTLTAIGGQYINQKALNTNGPLEEEGK